MTHGGQREHETSGAWRRGTRLPARLALVLVGVGGLGGCAATAPGTGGARDEPAAHAGAEEPAPQAREARAVLTRYRDALVQGRPDDAWALLVPGTLDRETFRAYFADHRYGMILEAQEALRVARSTPPTEVVFVRSGPWTYEVVRTPAGWRIRSVQVTEPPRGAGAAAPEAGSR